MARIKYSEMKRLYRAGPHKVFLKVVKSSRKSRGFQDLYFDRHFDLFQVYFRCLVCQFSRFLCSLNAEKLGRKKWKVQKCFEYYKRSPKKKIENTCQIFRPILRALKSKIKKRSQHCLLVLLEILGFFGATLLAGGPDEFLSTFLKLRVVSPKNW